MNKISNFPTRENSDCNFFIVLYLHILAEAVREGYNAKNEIRIKYSIENIFFL